ncbi:hypothetical protein IscW_ISCW020312, partial [Ixodes scapularis]
PTRGRQKEFLTTGNSKNRSNKRKRIVERSCRGSLANRLTCGPRSRLHQRTWPPPPSPEAHAELTYGQLMQKTQPKQQPKTNRRRAQLYTGEGDPHETNGLAESDASQHALQRRTAV